MSKKKNETSRIDLPARGSLFDPTWRYRPSYDTDVARTIKRERGRLRAAQIAAAHPALPVPQAPAEPAASDLFNVVPMKVGKAGAR